MKKIYVERDDFLGSNLIHFRKFPSPVWLMKDSKKKKPKFFSIENFEKYQGFLQFEKKQQCKDLEMRRENL